MADEKGDKITVSYDELNTRKVEQRLKEQDALARNRIYAAMDETVVTPADADPRGLGALWRNSIFSLAVFGLIGGLLAWGCGSLLEFKGDTVQDTARRMEGVRNFVSKISDRPGAGSATVEEVRRWVDGAVGAGRRESKHFALAVIPKDAELRMKALDAIDSTRNIVKAEADKLARKAKSAATAPANEPLSARQARQRERAAAEARLAEQKAELDKLQQRRDKEIADGRRDNPDFAVMVDPNLSSDTKQAKLQQMQVERDRQMAEIISNENVQAFVGNILAYGVRGIILGICLAIAVPLTENNLPATLINGSVGAALGLLGGVAAAFVTDRIRSSVAGAAPDSQVQYLATVAIYGVWGLFLTLAPGVVMRNPKKLVIGLTGGLIGGLIGGVLAEPIYKMSEQPRLAELVAMISIGLLAGLATGLIEDVAKTGWLKVSQGFIAGKQFILYRNPTFIGAGPDCQIYLFKDPKVGKRHAAIHIVPGGFELEDLPLGTETLLNGKPARRSRLKNGDRIQVGGTQLVFMEKTQAAG